MRIRHKILLLGLLLLSHHITVLSQEQRLELNIGTAPILDALHIGLALHITPTFEIGFSAGTIPYDLTFNKYLNFGVEGKYNFGLSKQYKTRIEIDGKRKRVPIRTWYTGLRANFVQDNHEYKTEITYFYLIPTIGRHCHFNKKAGLNIDFGLAFTLNEYTLYKGDRICQSCFVDIHPQTPIKPTVRIQFFFKI